MKYQAIDVEYLKLLQEQKEFEYMKKLMYKGIKYGYYIFILIIILSAFFSGNLVLAQTNNIGYEFGNSYVYDGVLPETSDLVNQRYPSLPNGVFPATYTFTNETGLNGTDISWITWDGSVGDPTREVVSNIDGHTEVIYLYDNTNPNYFNVRNNFSDRESGTIEFWIKHTDPTYDFNLYIRNGAGQGVYLSHSADLFKYNDGALKSTGKTMLADTWYHERIDFECGAGGYLGLGADQFYWTIDGERFGAYGFNSPRTNLNMMWFQSSGATGGFGGYIDAIGYSWDAYFFTDFEGEGTGSTPIGFTNVNALLVTVETKLGSNLLEMYDNQNNDYCRGYFELDSFYNKIIEFDIAKSGIGSTDGIDVRLWSGGTMNIYLEFRENDLRYNNGSYHYIKQDFLSVDTFYTVRLEIDDSANTFDVYIDDVLELDDGNFLYDSITTSDRLYLETWNVGLNYYGYIDDLNIFSLLGYNIGDNLLSNTIFSNDTETDKFEFTFDDSAIINVNGDDDVSGFTDLENDYWDNDVVNLDDSIDDDIDKCIRITSAHKGNCGIERDFGIGSIETSQVHWQFDLHQFGYPEGDIYIKIENNESDTIAFFWLRGARFEVAPMYDKLANLSYYYDGSWVLLQSNIPVYNNYNMTFALNWTNGDNFGLLGFDGNLYNITFDQDQDSLGLFQIYANNDNNVRFYPIDLEIDWIRIIVNGSSLSDELMPDNVFILSGMGFNLKYQSFVEITFDPTYENNVSIFLNDEVQLLDYPYNTTAQSLFFGNFYQDSYFSGFFLKIYNSSEYKIDNIKLYGIQMINQQDSNDNPFLEFDYNGVDPNISYFYVSGIDLHYRFETNNNSELEYIQATFDVLDFSTEGYAISFTHRKGTTYLESECKILFTTDTFLSFLSNNISMSESLILPQDKVIKEIVFLITDDTNEIIDTSEGYFKDFLFIYYSDIGITITTLSLLDVFPIVVLVVIIPIAIYVGFGRRKELLVPAIMGMSIFGTVVEIIPLWLEFIIMFGCISYYLIRRLGGN